MFTESVPHSHVTMTSALLIDLRAILNAFHMDKELSQFFQVISSVTVKSAARP